MILDTDQFQRIFDNKAGYLKELDDEYLDTSLAAKGITVIYRDSRYKKKVRLIIILRVEKICSNLGRSQPTSACNGKGIFAG